MTTRSRGLAIWATTLVAGAAFTSLTRGDTEAELEVVPGVTATVTAEMTIVSKLCSGTDTDQDVASVSGTAKAILAPTQPPFNEILIDPMYIQFSEMSFNFQFDTCTAVLFIDFLEISPWVFLHGPIDNDAVEFVDDLFLGWGTMSAYVAGIPFYPFHFGTVRPTTLSGRVTGDATTATLDNLAIGSIHGEVLQDQLSTGIDSIIYTITADLTGVALTGPRIEIEALCDPVGIYTFTGCMTGPDGGLWGFCGCIDADDNGHIDLRDFAHFQSHFGP